MNYGSAGGNREMSAMKYGHDGNRGMLKYGGLI
jgi:hypothetical protein